MYRIKDQFPDFSCKKTTFFRYVKDLREQTGYVRRTNALRLSGRKRRRDMKLR
jgi:hypothetical protein